MTLVYCYIIKLTVILRLSFSHYLKVCFYIGCITHCMSISCYQ